jgi:hypothetical protein
MNGMVLALLLGTLRPAATPTFNPGAGTYSSTQTVTVSTATAGSTIRCTTDGSTPTALSTKYTAAFSVSSSETIKCIAKSRRTRNSAVATAAYVISSGSWVAKDNSACTNASGTPCEWEPCKNASLPATVYYVCDTGGDDGRTPAQAQNISTPWATAGKANGQFSSLSAGQAIAFCRGGTFSGGDNWSNSNGTSGNPTIIRDYTRSGREGLDPRPVFSGDFNFAGQNVKVLNLSLNVGSMGTSGNIDGLTVCSSEMYGVAQSIGFYAGGAAAGNQNITIRGSRFIHHGLTGYLGAQNNLLIEDNYWWDNGFNDPGYPANQRHTIYLGGTNELSANCTVRRNDIHAANVGTVAMVTHGQHTNLTYESNTVRFEPPVQNTDAGSWGISLKCGYGCDASEWNHNVVIRGNTVINAGNQSINADMCSQGCLVENNLVINNQQSTTGIAVPAGDDPTGQTTGAVVRNNTVYLTQGGTGIDVGNSGTSYTVANNVSQSTGTCFSVSNATFNDYNGYYNCAQSPVGANSWKQNPQFVSPITDFHPAAGSPLIGDGTNAQNPGIDITGAARPNPPSIGAYEPP